MTEALDEIQPVDVVTAEVAASAPAPSGFVKKIAAIFAARVVVLGFSIATSLVITKLLVPEDRGAYVAVVTMPAMLMALALLGLPNAVNYFAGRGSSVASLIRASLLFTVLISAMPVLAVWLALPLLEQSILRAAPDHLARVMLLVVPAGILTSFGGTLLYGRQEVRVYNAVLVLQAVASLAGAIVLVGVLRLGVTGAVATSVTISLATALIVMLEVLRLNARDKRGSPASIRGLIGYGLRLYPSSLSGYFNYRADNNIIQALAPSVGAAESSLGLYSFAVTMAEVVFLVPESVATMFLPRVAGSTAEEAAAMLGRVARVTLLLSLLVAVALIPVAFLGVNLVLPKYVGCLPAFLAILPGVIALSVSKVMTGYIGGRGRPGPASIGATVTLVLNILANLALIPLFGIVGASLASVMSYGSMALLMVWVASRMSGQPLLSLWIPQRSDFTVIRDGVVRLARHVVSIGRGSTSRAQAGGSSR
jgi:O-antigen/teichoic acid export membrane protein